MNSDFPYSDNAGQDAGGEPLKVVSDIPHEVASGEGGAGLRHSMTAIVGFLKNIAATSGGETLIKFQIMAVVLLISSFMLFWNLGHYSLWEDEAVTALAAKGIVRTGDTYALVDGNLVAYGNGLGLHNLHDRITPLLPVYATALSFMGFGENTWTARFPHALAGLLAVVLLLRWASKGGIRHLLLVSILMIGNASFFLFFRQCGYYGFAMFFTLLVFYLYWHWNGGRKKTIFLSLAMLGLMFSYYVTYAGVAVAIALDYILWRRKEVSLKWEDWLIIMIPQVAGVLAAYLYGAAHGSFWAGNGVAGTIKAIFIDIWDMNRSEHYSVFLMLIALGLGWYKRQKGIGRAMLAVLAVVAVTATLAEMPSPTAQVADVRFLPAIIALCLMVEARGISLLCGGKMLASIVLAIFAGFSNFSNGGMFFQEGVRSTSFLFVRELINPPNTDPFRPTAEWMIKNIPAGALVYVEPNSSVYPLMFLANHVFYSWQLDDRSQAQFKDLPPVFFKGECSPDFVIVFGSRSQEANNILTRFNPPNTLYREAARLDVYANELFRPEILTHAFLPVKGYTDDQIVKIYKRDGFDPAKIPNNPALRFPVRAPAAPEPAPTEAPKR